ncbi:hypothetical protein B0O99DRAFT_167894 [Bisporella sp. PMI_857]|nr:hypothetical protein B0O99DRAFT_167894 [Bisporella sp. PMI_857]
MSTENTQQATTAQYSCDHCRQRKLRCSRTIPRCNNCQGWPGECVYSRHGRLKRRPRANVLARAAERMQTAPSQPVPILPLPLPSFTTQTISDSPSRQSYVEPLPPPLTTSFLSQANNNIEQLKGKLTDQRLYSSAENSLSELSSTFAALDFEDESDVRMNVREFLRNRDAFFIPTADEGRRMIEVFFLGIERGKPFFTTPPKDLLPKLAFEPAAVKERGWLLLFNAFLSGAMKRLQPPESTRLIQGLQWNTWMVLEDSSIILDPSELNIQALIVVATHGQEISSLSLCWTLISQACSMAQTLAIHVPTHRAPLGSDVYLQRNCLFWALFIIDKSLSLSFGRPPRLPGYMYKHVPVPDAGQIAHMFRRQEFNLRMVSDWELGTSDKIWMDEFGVMYVNQIRELAKLQGEVSDTLNAGISDSECLDKLKEGLDQWMEIVIKMKAKFGTCSSKGSSEELEAIELGANFLSFQYHHLMVYLTRSDKSKQDICLASAGSAISLLDKLVSDTTQIYSGIVWQLLYQPFMPYFVIFAKIISDPRADDCFVNLKLLQQVVLYFLRIHNNHQSAKRLEKVAETFTRLAEAYVRHSIQQQPNDNISAHEDQGINENEDANNFPSQEDCPDLTATSAMETEASTVSSTDSPQAFSTNNLSDFSAFQSSFGIADMNSDPMALLNFFSATPGYEIGDMSSHPEAEFPADGQTPTPQVTDSPSRPLIRGLETIAQNQGLDGNFDWLSWDQQENPLGQLWTGGYRKHLPPLFPVQK